MSKAPINNIFVTIVILGIVTAIVVPTITGCIVRPKEPQIKMVTIAFQEFIGYGPFYLAQGKGFFKDEGIDLIFVNEQLDSARNDAFRQRMLDCEATTLDVLIAKRSKGVPVVAVMELDRSNGVDGIAATPAIRTLEDLVGKKVVLARDDTSETFLEVLLHDRNIPMDKIDIISKPPEGVAAAFLKKEADAAVTWEPQLSDALKRPGAHLLITSRDTPGIIIDVLSVRDDILAKDPKLVKGLMRGWFKAVTYYNEHPKEASEMMAGYYGITPDQYRQAVSGLSWVTYKDQVSADWYKKLTDIFNTISELKFSKGKIEQKPEIKDSINIVFLKELYENSR